MARTVLLSGMVIGTLATNALIGQSSLHLSVRMDGDTFFQGEPAFALFQLTNRGSDTVWVSPFGLALGALRGSLSRAGGAVSERRFTQDVVASGGWRGLPLPPGESVYEVDDLHLRWGENGPLSEGLFALDLPPGTYVLKAVFDPTPTSAGQSRLPLVEADPATFTVRSRSAGEEVEYRDVQTLGTILSQRGGSRRFLASILDWTERRLGADSADRFVDFLLSAGIYISAGRGLWPDAVTAARLAAIQGRVVDVQRHRVAGAAVAATFAAHASRHRDRSAVDALRRRVSGTLADSVLVSAMQRGSND